MRRPPPRIKGASGKPKASRPGSSSIYNSRQSNNAKDKGLKELNIRSSPQPLSATKKKNRKEEKLGIIVSPRSPRNSGLGSTSSPKQPSQNKVKPSSPLSLELSSSGSNRSSLRGLNTSLSPKNSLGSSGGKLSPVGKSQSPKQLSPRLQSLTPTKSKVPSRPAPRITSKSPSNITDNANKTGKPF